MSTQQLKAAEPSERLPSDGWHRPVSRPSLPEVFRTIPVPRSASSWRRFLAFFGPGYLVAVGYMDPGNWATDISGGSQFGYSLLAVILVSNVMAMLFQAAAVRLGFGAGGDFASA